jgi:hypothetical protein
MVNQAYRRGNIVSQYTAKRLNTEVDRYIWSGGTDLWKNSYEILRDVNNLYNIAKERDLPNYQGISLVLKSLIYSVLTDTYGQVPYSQAIKGQTNDIYKPKFDKQKEVYDGMLSDLKEANTLLNPDKGQIEGDILYNGDVLKWKKLANSLQLRLLIRISNKEDVSSKISSIVDNSNSSPIFTSNDDNAALEYLPDLPNQWPLHTARSGFILEYRLSATFDSVLTKWDDPRLKVFFNPTKASANSSNPKWKGVPNGLNDAKAHSYAKDKVSRISNRYYEEPNSAKGLIMTYSEVQFILAEAAERGMINGSASNYYYQGIKASFDQYGLNTPSNYLAQPGVIYDPSNALQEIGYQKWIALFFTGKQGWFTWRRTGYPLLKAGPYNENKDLIPVRFQYPNEEQVQNTENYKQAIQEQGSNTINTKIWEVE